jgi:hypothetical protein
MRHAVGLFLVAVVGCFDPGPAPLRCSEAQPGCPDGLTCVSGTCQEGTGSADAAGGVDLAVVDLSLPDMTEVSGCTSGVGFKIGAGGCWGCAGSFDTNKKASSLCANGFAPPSNSDRISNNDCLSVTGGFFFSALYGATSSLFSDLNFSQCGYFTMGTGGFFGCGTAEGSGVVNPVAACSGFRPFIQCRTFNGVICLKEFLDGISNSKPTNGVICCPK